MRPGDRVHLTDRNGYQSIHEHVVLEHRPPYLLAAIHPYDESGCGQWFDLSVWTAEIVHTDHPDNDVIEPSPPRSWWRVIGALR